MLNVLKVKKKENGTGAVFKARRQILLDIRIWAN